MKLAFTGFLWWSIIPYQEPPGNYNKLMRVAVRVIHYTIPRTTGELQLLACPCCWPCRLYHTKNHRGTTTQNRQTNASSLLYHTKNHRGTTTLIMLWLSVNFIIPYQEPPGNYNWIVAAFQRLRIIPYQEPPGNYNVLEFEGYANLIIPYQEPPGNYNPGSVISTCSLALYHTKNHRGTTTAFGGRPLRFGIIPYQEPPGNYNPRYYDKLYDAIIPYQEPPGNYNRQPLLQYSIFIIPYQEPPGNYNRRVRVVHIVFNYTIPRTTGELQHILYLRQKG